MNSPTRRTAAPITKPEHVWPPDPRRSRDRSKAVTARPVPVVVRRTGNVASRLGAVVMLCALGFSAGSAHAQTDPVFADGQPRVWCWNEPLGDAATDARFVGMVNIPLNYIYVVDGTNNPATADRTGAHVADVVAAEIRQRSLTAGRIAILLGGIGMGNLGFQDYVAPDGHLAALFFHYDDSITFDLIDAGGGSASSRTFRTPWMGHGIAETGAWMAEFIDTYQHQRSGVPDPDRFVFDLEVYGTDYQSSIQAMFVPDQAGWQAAQAYWDALQADPRWDDGTPVPGFSGQQMADIWAAAAITGPEAYGADPTNYVGGSAGNHRWFRWFKNLLYQAQEGAMDEALFSPIRAAWPQCKSSNYETSMRLDGAGHEHRNTSINATSEAALTLMRNWWTGYGDKVAPVLYPGTSSYHLDRYWVTDDECAELPWAPHEPVTEAWLRRARFVLDACVRSFDGADRWNLSPWVTLPNQLMPIYGEAVAGIPYPSGIEHRASNDEVRRMLALARGHGAKELLLWNDLQYEPLVLFVNPPTDPPGSYRLDLHPQHPYNWSRFRALVDQVWGLGFGSRSTLDGYAESVPPGAEVHPLEFAHGDPLVVGTWPSTSSAAQAITFTNAGGQTSHLRVDIELTCTADTWLEAYVRKTDGQLVPIDLTPTSSGSSDNSAEVCAGERVHASGRIATSSGFYGSGNEVTIVVRLAATGTDFEGEIDMVRLMADDDVHRALADFNSDGVVDLLDQYSFEALFEHATVTDPGFHPPELDLTHDGLIDSADEDLFLDAHAICTDPLAAESCPLVD